MNGQRTKRAAAPPWYGRTLLAGVIDVVDFAAARNGERDINPANLVAVVETFSDPRYPAGSGAVRPRPGEKCHDYACGSARLLVNWSLANSARLARCRFHGERSPRAKTGTVFSIPIAGRFLQSLRTLPPSAVTAS